MVGDVRVRPEGGDDWTDLGSLVWQLPPDRAVDVDTGEITFERPGRLSFEIRPAGLSWSTEITG